MGDQPFVITDEHREVLGKEFVRREQHVTRELLLEYADLMGITHPIYHDPEAARAQGYRDIIAMPMFLIAEASLPLVPIVSLFPCIMLNSKSLFD